MVAVGKPPHQSSLQRYLPSSETSFTFVRDVDYELIGDTIFSRYANPIDEQLAAFINQLKVGWHTQANFA